MDTKYISYILTIAKLKNMTKAAEELYVSQSSLSQYLSKLEQELGTPLFYRTKWELVPTPAGELYIEACHQVMNVKEQLYRQIKQLTGKTPVAFLRSTRLKRAAELLKQDRFSVSEVMYMVGMSNASYFTKCFTNEFGIAPKQFVQEHNGHV